MAGPQRAHVSTCPHAKRIVGRALKHTQHSLAAGHARCSAAAAAAAAAAALSGVGRVTGTGARGADAEAAVGGPARGHGGQQRGGHAPLQGRRRRGVAPARRLAAPVVAAAAAAAAAATAAVAALGRLGRLLFGLLLLFLLLGRRAPRARLLLSVLLSQQRRRRELGAPPRGLAAAVVVVVPLLLVRRPRFAPASSSRASSARPAVPVVPEAERPAREEPPLARALPAGRGRKVARGRRPQLREGRRRGGWRPADAGSARAARSRRCARDTLRGVGHTFLLAFDGGRPRGRRVCELLEALAVAHKNKAVHPPLLAIWVFT
jgi:hypothetical protein